MKRLLKAAGEKWDMRSVEDLRSTFDVVAEAVCKVEQFKLEPGAEPAYPTTIFRQRARRKRKRTEGK